MPSVIPLVHAVCRCNDTCCMSLQDMRDQQRAKRKRLLTAAASARIRRGMIRYLTVCCMHTAVHDNQLAAFHTRTLTETTFRWTAAYGTKPSLQHSLSLRQTLLGPLFVKGIPASPATIEDVRVHSDCNCSSCKTVLVHAMPKRWLNNNV